MWLKAIINLFELRKVIPDNPGKSASNQFKGLRSRIGSSPDK